MVTSAITLMSRVLIRPQTFVSLVCLPPVGRFGAGVDRCVKNFSKSTKAAFLRTAEPSHGYEKHVGGRACERATAPATAGLERCHRTCRAVCSIFGAIAHTGRG